MVDPVARPLRARTGVRTALLSLALLPALAALPAAASAAEAPVGLGTAGAFSVLGGSAITNTGTSTILGDVGVFPGTARTGFGPCPAAGCVALTGTDHGSDAVAQQAKSDLTIAYGDAAGRTGGTAVSAPLGGGQTLVPGLYSAATDLAVDGDLTLDAGGDPNATFIFQARTGTLITAAGTTSGIPNARVLLTNGAQACNVTWQVGTSATLGTSTQFAGSILADQSITATTGATVTGGRLLAMDAAVTLDSNTIRRADCATPTTPGTTPPTSGTTPSPTTPEGSTTPAAGTTTPVTATTPTSTPDGTAGPQGTPSTTATTPAAGTATPVAPAGTPAVVGTPSATTTSGPGTPGGPGSATGAVAPAAFAIPTAAAKPRETARITGPGGPVTGPFTVSVAGRQIAGVTFYVDGRERTTVSARPGRRQFRLRLTPRRGDGRVHRVTARVRFRTGGRTTTLRVTYRGPVAPRGPRFTG